MSSACRADVLPTKLHLFRCVLSSLLPLRSVGRSNFDKGLQNLITLILKKRLQIMILLYYIMESTVDSYEHYLYIYKTLNETAKGNFKNTFIQ